MRVEGSNTEARFFLCPFSRTKWIKTAQNFRGYFYSQSPRNMGPVSSKLGKNLQKSSALDIQALCHLFLICISSIYSSLKSSFSVFAY